MNVDEKKMSKQREDQLVQENQLMKRKIELQQDEYARLKSSYDSLEKEKEEIIQKSAERSTKIQKKLREVNSMYIKYKAEHQDVWVKCRDQEIEIENMERDNHILCQQREDIKLELQEKIIQSVRKDVALLQQSSVIEFKIDEINRLKETLSIYKSKNVELKRRINEFLRAEKELTNLANDLQKQEKKTKIRLHASFEAVNNFLQNRGKYGAKQNAETDESEESDASYDSNCDTCKLSNEMARENRSFTHAACKKVAEFEKEESDDSCSSCDSNCEACKLSCSPNLQKMKKLTESLFNKKRLEAVKEALHDETDEEADFSQCGSSKFSSMNTAEKKKLSPYQLYRKRRVEAVQKALYGEPKSEEIDISQCGSSKYVGTSQDGQNSQSSDALSKKTPFHHESQDKKNKKVLPIKLRKAYAKKRKLDDTEGKITLKKNKPSLASRMKNKH